MEYVSNHVATYRLLYILYMYAVDFLASDTF